VWIASVRICACSCLTFAVFDPNASWYPNRIANGGFDDLGATLSPLNWTSSAEVQAANSSQNNAMQLNGGFLSQFVFLNQTSWSTNSTAYRFSVVARGNGAVEFNASIGFLNQNFEQSILNVAAVPFTQYDLVVNTSDRILGVSVRFVGNLTIDNATLSERIVIQQFQVNITCTEPLRFNPDVGGCVIPCDADIYKGVSTRQDSCSLIQQSTVGNLQLWSLRLLERFRSSFPC
jgi:hypothetical protein